VPLACGGTAPCDNISGGDIALGIGGRRRVLSSNSIHGKDVMGGGNVPLRNALLRAAPRAVAIGRISATHNAARRNNARAGVDMKNNRIVARIIQRHQNMEIALAWTRFALFSFFLCVLSLSLSPSLRIYPPSH